MPGLRGVSFGDSLIKRVAETLKEEFPKLKTFATLSPIPGFRGWLGRQVQARIDALTDKAALSALMAELARSGKDPEAVLGDSVVRLLGFAESAALGLAGQPGVLTTAPTAAASANE